MTSWSRLSSGDFEFHKIVIAVSGIGFWYRGCGTLLRNAGPSFGSSVEHGIPYRFFLLVLPWLPLHTWWMERTGGRRHM